MCTDGHPHDHAHPHPPALPLVGGDRMDVADWPGERIPLEPVDAVEVTIVCDNSFDMLLADTGPARRFRTASAAQVPCPTFESGLAGDFPHAEHGFSALVSVTKGDRTHHLLFDTGVTPDGCTENLRRLDRSPWEVEAIVVSHGHFDHAAGLAGLTATLGSAGMPVLVHPEFWNRRRVAVPGLEPFELPTTSRRGLEEAGFTIVEQRRPSFLFERSVLVTGEVDRVTPFEVGFAPHQAWRHDHWEPDPLILDDQALVVHVAGKGLVVLTGCGHAGVVNITRYARYLTNVEEVAAIIGGFHLGGPLFEPVIAPTCEALATLAPQVLVPAHCTGWKATHAIAARFPAAFVQTAVGTTLRLECPTP